ncbi:MAG: hypothetical protein HHJ11_12540 [Phycicoccus sp.]|nr:hypothetical protein [Phycicoccus sp.]NMM35088.1 hypothetical protein [Phycicoccus sp.]
MHISEADESAAHIAELVRRTTEAKAKPRPSSVAPPNATMAQAPPTPTRQIPAPPVTPVAAPPAAPTSPPDDVTPPPAIRPQSRMMAWSPSRMTTRLPSRLTTWPPSRSTLAVAGVLVVLLVGGGVALSRPSGSTATPPAPTVQAAAPAGYVVKVTDAITDCAGHSRGKTQVSFKAENCLKATRLLATGEVGGRPVLFVVSRIQMTTSEAAASVKRVLDGNGTGNLNDLLRDGMTYPGAPAKMPVSGYASVQTGTVVTVAEAGFIDGRSSNTDPALRAAAAAVATKVSTQA